LVAEELEGEHMFVLVTYDVATTTAAGQQRLRRVAKACKNYGQRVQYSVFECIVDPAQWTFLRDQLVEIIDEDKDSLRFYYLGSNWHRRVEHVGAKAGIDQEGTLIA
jgi:CRISPR-associated protein Cas2